MSDALLDRLGKTSDGTGYDRRQVRRLEAGGTVSLLHDAAGVGGVVEMGRWLVGATTPADLRAADELSIPVAIRLVVNAENAEQAAVELGALAARASVLANLVLTVSGSAVDLTAYELEIDAEEAAPARQAPIGVVGESDTERMSSLASRAAAELPAVEVREPDLIELSDSPVDNARRLFGLTVAQLASLLGVTERQVYRFDPAKMASDRRAKVDALVAVGLILAGGLAPDGARRWLDSGEPSAWSLLSEGRTAELRARAEDLQDSVAT